MNSALVIPELTDKCYLPPYQFGFQKGLGCAHGLTALSSILIDADKSGDSLVQGSHDVSHAFDSLIHAQILLELYKRGVDPSAIRALYDMYNHLAVVIKLPDGTITLFVIPVCRGVRQGAVTSPVAFNNCILNAQSSAVPSCILKGIDVSLIAYADDIFNPSRTVQSFERNFAILSKEYAKINLTFNVALLGSKQTSTQPQTASKTLQCFCTPKFPIPFAPFWRTFTITETKELGRIYFRYAKYLLALPPWSSNSWVIKRYGIIDPNASIRKSIEAYNSRIGRHPWSAILIQ